MLVYGDCAVNPDPTATQLADIAIASARTAAAFGVEPRVAMLSYSTGTSGSGTDVNKVTEATARVRERAPDLLVEGPIQYDAAIDAAVARTKLPDSAVAGRATVFVFPDLNTGIQDIKILDPWEMVRSNSRITGSARVRTPLAARTHSANISLHSI